MCVFPTKDNEMTNFTHILITRRDVCSAYRGERGRYSEMNTLELMLGAERREVILCEAPNTQLGDSTVERVVMNMRLGITLADEIDPVLYDHYSEDWA